VLALEQNYPNPFNPSTSIGYRLPGPGHVSLRIYDMLGREVATLVDAVQPGGRYTATFRGAGCASGVYLCRITTPFGTLIRSMTLVR
jgi:hypothetical protein